MGILIGLDSVCAIDTKDGIRIISGSDDKTVRIWDLEGNQIAVCEGHTGSVSSVCAIDTKYGIKIISGSNDNTVRIWDMQKDFVIIFAESLGIKKQKALQQIYLQIQAKEFAIENELNIYDFIKNYKEENIKE